MREERPPAEEKSFKEVEEELQAGYNSILDCCQTPFDIICEICLFRNSERMDDEVMLEIHNEKLDILIALFN